MESGHDPRSWQEWEKVSRRSLRGICLNEGGKDSVMLELV